MDEVATVKPNVTRKDYRFAGDFFFLFIFENIIEKFSISLGLHSLNQRDGVSFAKKYAKVKNFKPPSVRCHKLQLQAAPDTARCLSELFVGVAGAIERARRRRRVADNTVPNTTTPLLQKALDGVVAWQTATPSLTSRRGRRTATPRLRSRKRRHVDTNNAEEGEEREEEEQDEEIVVAAHRKRRLRTTSRVSAKKRAVSVDESVVLRQLGDDDDDIEDKPAKRSRGFFFFFAEKY